MYKRLSFGSLILHAASMCSAVTRARCSRRHLYALCGGKSTLLRRHAPDYSLHALANATTKHLVSVLSRRHEHFALATARQSTLLPPLRA